MHAVMDAILRRRQSNVLMPHEMHLTAKSLLGLKFHDRVFTQEHLDTMITPALDHLIALEREYATAETTAFFVVGVETLLNGVLRGAEVLTLLGALILVGSALSACVAAAATLRAGLPALRARPQAT